MYHACSYWHGQHSKRRQIVLQHDLPDAVYNVANIALHIFLFLGPSPLQPTPLGGRGALGWPPILGSGVISHKSITASSLCTLNAVCSAKDIVLVDNSTNNMQQKQQKYQYTHCSGRCLPNRLAIAA